MEDTYSQVLDFRAELVGHPGAGGAVRLLDGVIGRLTALRYHRFSLDAGISLQAFWDEGDRIVELLKNVTRLIVM